MSVFFNFLSSSSFSFFFFHFWAKVSHWSRTHRDSPVLGHPLHSVHHFLSSPVIGNWGNSELQVRTLLSQHLQLQELGGLSFWGPELEAAWNQVRSSHNGWVKPLRQTRVPESRPSVSPPKWTGAKCPCKTVGLLWWMWIQWLPGSILHILAPA